MVHGYKLDFSNDDGGKIKISMIELLNIDCLEYMKGLRDDSIDCVITDPPYSGLLSKGRGANGGRFDQTNNHIEFDDMSERAFLMFIKPIFRELYRVLKLGSHLYCFTDWKQMRNMADCLELSSLKIVNIICWDKGHFGTGAGYRSQSEYVLLFSKGIPNVFNLNNIGNVIKCKRSDETEHPHEKPYNLLRIFIENSTQEKEIIYDPFMGSGSCMVAAHNTGRKFIGTEISKDFYDAACKRYKEKTAQTILFQ